MYSTTRAAKRIRRPQGKIISGSPMTSLFSNKTNVAIDGVRKKEDGDHKILPLLQLELIAHLSERWSTCVKACCAAHIVQCCQQYCSALLHSEMNITGTLPPLLLIAKS